MPTQYVDGFVLPIPKDKIEAYRQIAEKAAAIFMELGALEYRETVGDDLDVEYMLPFPKLTQISADETIVFAWIVYASREHRDEVNAKIHSDPRMKEIMTDELPMDCTRMAYGGFKTIVQH